MPIRIGWNRPRTNAGGGGFGYYNLVKQIDSLIVHDASSKYLLSCSPTCFWEVPKGTKKNILFTMFESMDLPVGDPEKLKHVHALIVPSKWNAEAYAQHTDVPIYVVPLGADPKRFPWKSRTYPSVFRWLSVTAMDERKRWDQLEEIWDSLFAKMPGAELYWKTSGSNKDIGIFRDGNVTVDTRRIPESELVELYHNSHGFITLSAGEGWGYPIMESIMTGLPCLATTYGAQTEYFNQGTGFPIVTNVRRFAVTLEGKGSCAPDGLFEFGDADYSSVINQMLYVMKNYAKATEKARRASKHVGQMFSLEKFNRNLTRVLDTICAS